MDKYQGTLYTLTHFNLRLFREIPEARNHCEHQYAFFFMSVKKAVKA